MDLLFYIIAGAGVGLAVGLTGVGGGSLMTPLLIFSGVPTKIAIGTDLLYAAITKTGGVIAHKRLGSIRWRLVLLLCLGSIPGSILTTVLLHDIFNSEKDYTPLLNHSLGIMLILTSLVLLLKKYLIKESQKHAKEHSRFYQQAPAITVFAGFILGVLVTLSSVGAGAFCAALLLVLYPRLPALHVVGTDIAHAVPLTLAAGFAHMFVLHNVDLTLLAGLVIGSIPAVYVGAKIAVKVPNTVLQPFLGGLLLLIGLKFTFF